jgi:hypothetical protein
MNWKQKYLDLAERFCSQFEKEAYNLRKEVEKTVQQDLEERGKCQFCRLKVPYYLHVEYDSGQPGEERFFEAGTLIQAVIRGKMAHVYLDLEGDGHLYFPEAVLEEVEIDEDCIEKYHVVWQG